MMSVGLARKAAAAGASAAVLAALGAGLVASPAQAATSATAAASKTAKVSVSTPKAAVRDYEGSCPTEVDFSATIKVPVKGKTKLSYRWLHGDGSKGKVRSLTLTGKGTKSVTVKQSITFKDDVKGWEAVQVLGPKSFTSKKGYFSVSCKEPMKLREARTHLNVSARAWASPSTYVGSCTTGKRISFSGVISSNRPAWVRYRWVLNGDAVDYGKIKVNDSRRVGFSISPRHSGRGYAQLQVLSPDRASSNRAEYKVWCKDKDRDEHSAPSYGAEVKASVSASTTSDCKVSASGSIFTKGAAKARYSWLLNGQTVGGGEVSFDRHGGSKSVSLTKALNGAATKGGSVTLAVSGPRNSETVTAFFAACKTPEPPAKDTVPAPKETATATPSVPAITLPAK
ncbi:hypothetical protein [Nonomuraea jiangxiensis]|uniref:Ig-like domain-containing protein n=1 Tax=Nonomuraea jiangxiensis TaxID=633440 RepID=A0A1G8NUD5_9ACTN|nr:hypothetical protein [Nonomuraea jiangxiensis]SDI83832.1 hypothetical protein SAMN05421869_107234 [Nonomuraea jiangxiensis]